MQISGVPGLKLGNRRLFKTTRYLKVGTVIVVYIVVQHLYIPVTLRTAEGSLNVVPDRLLLKKCFPVGFDLSLPSCIKLVFFLILRAWQCSTP